MCVWCEDYRKAYRISDTLHRGDGVAPIAYIGPMYSTYTYIYIKSVTCVECAMTGAYAICWWDIASQERRTRPNVRALDVYDVIVRVCVGVCVCVCTNANLIEKLIYTKATSGLAAQSAILPPTVYNMCDFSSSSSPESIRISMAVHLIYMRFAFRIEPSAVFVLYIYSYMMLARFARYADGQQLDKATTTKVCAHRMYDKRIESCGRYSLCFTYLMVVHKPDDNLFESDDNRHG